MNSLAKNFEKCWNTPQMRYLRCQNKVDENTTYQHFVKLSNILNLILIFLLSNIWIPAIGSQWTSTASSLTAISTRKYIAIWVINLL